MPKVLFQLYIDVTHFNYIDKKAKETGRSRAALVREMIEEQIKKNTEKEALDNAR